MSSEEVAEIRADIRTLQTRAEENHTDIMLIQSDMDRDHGERKERQDKLDEQLGKMNAGINDLLDRNKRVDGWFSLTKSAAIWIGAVGAAAALVMKLVFKVF